MNMRPKLTKLSSLALRELLCIGADTSVDEDECEREDSLRQQSVGAMLSEPSPVALTDIPNRTTFDCLLDRNQPASTFNLLKDYFKKATVTWQSESRADAARVLYYAAIAAAIAYHGQVITNLADRERKDALTYLANAAWMPTPLAALFREAIDTLRHNGNQSQ